MKRFLLSGFVSFAVLAGSLGSSAAQPTINSPFYEETKDTFCTTSVCGLEFSAITTGRVLFSKVTCGVFEVASTYSLNFIRISVRDTSGGSVRRLEFIPFSQPSTNPSGTKYYTTTAPLDFLFATGKRPTIEAFFSQSPSNSVSFNCKLTGRIQS